MKLELLMGTQKSHFAYRLAWENSSGERIPYIPLHRRDLVAAQDGNRTWMDGNEKMEGPNGQMTRRYVADGLERINWKKFEIMGDVVVGIQQAQAVPFPKIPRNDAVRESVMDIKLYRDEDVSLVFISYLANCEDVAADRPRPGPEQDTPEYLQPETRRGARYALDHI